MQVSEGDVMAATVKGFPEVEPVMLEIAVLVHPVEVVVPVTVYTVVTVGVAATVAVVVDDRPPEGLQR